MSDNRHDHFGKDGSERTRKKLVVDWTQVVAGLGGLDPAADYDVQVRREAIPIVVVPGLFGTRLETAAGAPLWEPSTSLLPEGGNAHRVASTYLRLAGLWSAPEDRARLFASGLRVADEGADNGWRSLCADSYGECLRRLERWPWSPSIRFCFHLPVHGFGYDWSADLMASGERLAHYLDELVESYRARGYVCDRVFLASHGSGGMVARAASVVHGASSRVLGVFHVGLPVHGTPAVYQWLKAGFRREEGPEGMAADLLGHTGKHVSALAACMPGLLQLLPRPDYCERQWMRFEGPDGAGVSALAADEIGDGGGRYWGLPIDEYPTVMKQINSWQHENSYVAVGRDVTTANDAVYRMSPRGRKKKFGRLTMMPVQKTDAETITERREGVTARGVFREGSFSASLSGPDGITLEVKLQPPHGDGDGVVPVAATLPTVSDQRTKDRLPRTRVFSGVGHFGLLRHGQVLDYLVKSIEQTCLDHMMLQVAV